MKSLVIRQNRAGRFAQQEINLSWGENYGTDQYTETPPFGSCINEAHLNKVIINLRNEETFEILDLRKVRK